MAVGGKNNIILVENGTSFANQNDPKCLLLNFVLMKNNPFVYVFCQNDRFTFSTKAEKKSVRSGGEKRVDVHGKFCDECVPERKVHPKRSTQKRCFFFFEKKIGDF